MGLRKNIKAVFFDIDGALRDFKTGIIPECQFIRWHDGRACDMIPAFGSKDLGIRRMAEAKQAADFVTDSIEKDGLRKAVFYILDYNSSGGMRHE